jgi:anti-sigma B factor antagonist
MTLEVTSTAREGAIVLAVKGDIDMSSADKLRRALDDAPARDRLVVDLTGVGYLDSAGVKVLYDCLDRSPELIVEPDAVILRILAITGLHEHLNIRNPQGGRLDGARGAGVTGA